MFCFVYVLYVDGEKERREPTLCKYNSKVSLKTSHGFILFIYIHHFVLFISSPFGSNYLRKEEKLTG